MPLLSPVYSIGVAESKVQSVNVALLTLLTVMAAPESGRMVTLLSLMSFDSDKRPPSRAVNTELLICILSIGISGIPLNLRALPELNEVTSLINMSQKRGVVSSTEGISLGAFLTK